MISLSTAQKLKAAGLVWTPALHDFFAVPDRGMDNRVFVISDIGADMALLKGQSIVTFTGTSDWALDYVMTAEVVWLPTEGQLRQALERHLTAGTQPVLKLIHAPDGYWCEIRFAGQTLSFRAAEAGEAYAEALLYVLEMNP
jgi:hypothetical protein